MHVPDITLHVNKPTDCRADTTAKVLFIWSFISTSTTGLRQGKGDNVETIRFLVWSLSCRCRVKFSIQSDQPCSYLSYNVVTFSRLWWKTCRHSI